MDVAYEPWNDPELFPSKPTENSYGYLKARKPVTCTREELISACGSASISAPNGPVWTPETTRTVSPVQIEWLLPAIKARARTNHVNALGMALVNVLSIGLIVAIVGRNAQSISPFLVAAIVLYLCVPIVASIRGLLASENLTWPFSERIQAEYRFQYWLGKYSQGTSLALFVLLMLLFFLAAMDRKTSIDVAGLVKEKVRAGEYWRLLTGALLHVNPLHFFMNGMFLINVGAVLEPLVHRWIIPLVFLIAALAGSVCSVLMFDKASIGASGGLMGLLGFLGVISYRLRDRIPVNYAWMAVKNSMLIGAIGILGYEYIDNAAHCGGLLTGAILGLFVQPDFNRVKIISARVTRALGILALILLILTGGWMSYALIQAR